LGILFAACAPKQAAVPARNLSPLLDLDATALWDPTADKLNTYLLDLQENHLMTGVALVARDDRIILARGYGFADKESKRANNLNTKFRIASLTKQFTAAAIMNLQAQGKLKVQDRACRYLAHCPLRWQGITIHQLLTHTSGIRDVTDYRDWLDFLAEPHTTDEVLQRYQVTPLEFAPGTKFKYSNSGYYVLGVVIENVSGQSYEAFMRDNFWKPLGMNDTGVAIDNSQLATGYPVGYVTRRGVALPFDNSNNLGNSSMYSTVSDLYRWAQALEHWQRDKYSDYHMMFEPYVIGDPTDTSYGYGLTIGERFGQKVIGHTGGLPGYSSFMAQFPESGVTEIFLSNDEELHIMFIEAEMSRMALEAQ